MPNNKDPFDEIFEDKKKDDAKIIENMTLEEAKKITNKISEYGIGNYIPKGMENKIKRTFVYWVGDVGHKAIKMVLKALEDAENERDEYKGYFESTYKRFRHLIESKFIEKYDQYDFKKRRLQIRYKRS